ncbi:MAG: Mrp/NBP35 family ATP-binding protein [Acidimicrobiia bacterium]|nr:Mrp/NBP35 family ATP-binding protein [Acidimicrobiia bacterium]
MPDEVEIRERIAGLEDPAIGRSLGELGLLGSVHVDGATVRVEVSVPSEDYPLRDRLDARIREAAGAEPGIENVEVSIGVLDDAGVHALAEMLRGGSPGAGESGVNPFTNASTRVLAVSSGKGGVGKSSVSANLAVALARAGHDVAVVDADVWGFSMPRMLGIDRPPTLVDDLIVPPSAHGVRLISMGFFAREDQPIIWRGPMLHKALEQFLTDVYWGEPDFLVVDMPPGTGDISMSMAEFLPRAEVLVVTTPQPAAQRVAQRAAYMARKVDLSVVGVIENMSWFRGDDGKAYDLFGSGGGADLAAELDVPLLGQVPLVPELRAGADEGRPIVAAHPEDEASIVFAEIARRVSDELRPSKVFKSELRIV